MNDDPTNNSGGLGQYQQAVIDAALKYNVDPDLALHVARQESNFNPNARGASGEIGIMQLMPGTAKDLGVDPHDPMANIDGGVRYLRQMQDQFGQDKRLVAAAYNAGPQRVQDWVAGKRLSLPQTTIDYVQKTALAPDKLYTPPTQPLAFSDAPPPGFFPVDDASGKGSTPSLPPLPDGAVLDDPSKLPPGFSVIPPLPDGAVLDDPAKLPEGFTIVDDTPVSFNDRWGNLSKSTIPASEQKSTATDVAEQLPSGVLEAAEGLPSAGPRLANLAGHGIQSALNYLFPNGGISSIPTPFGNIPTPGLDVKAMQKQQDADDARAAALQKITPSVSNVLPAPQTAAGSVARNIGEFAPAALMPGSVAQRAAAVVAPAVASQGAAKAAAALGASPEVQDAVRLATAIGTGARVAAGSEAAAAAPSLAAIKKAATEGYAAARNMGVELRPSGIQSLAQNIQTNLSDDGFRDYLAPKTFATLNEMSSPPKGGVVTISDLDGMRRVLGKAAMSADPTEQAAASKAINALDDYTSNIPQGDVLNGDAQAASKVLSEARANYAAQATAGRVQQKLRNADLRGGSTAVTQQNLRSLLTSKKQGRGLTQDELDLIESAARPSTVGNAVSGAGKLLGGDLGLTGALEAMGGAHFLGPAGYAIPAAGWTIKKVGDAITMAKANAIVNAIAARSPLAQQLAAARSAAFPTLVGRQATLSGLLSVPNASAQ